MYRRNGNIFNKRKAKETGKLLVTKEKVQVDKQRKCIYNDHQAAQT